MDSLARMGRVVGVTELDKIAHRQALKNVKIPKFPVREDDMVLDF